MIFLFLFHLTQEKSEFRFLAQKIVELGLVWLVSTSSNPTLVLLCYSYYIRSHFKLDYISGIFNNFQFKRLIFKLFFISFQVRQNFHHLFNLTEVDLKLHKLKKSLGCLQCSKKIHLAKANHLTGQMSDGLLMTGQFSYHQSTSCQFSCRVFE